MYNEDLFNKISREFGLSKAIEFTEMVSYMYKVLSEQPNSDPELGYEQKWWKQKHEQLKHNINVRLDGKISIFHEGIDSMDKENYDTIDGNKFGRS